MCVIAVFLCSESLAIYTVHILCNKPSLMYVHIICSSLNCLPITLLILNHLALNNETHLVTCAVYLTCAMYVHGLCVHTISSDSPLN